MAKITTKKILQCNMFSNFKNFLLVLLFCLANFQILLASKICKLDAKDYVHGEHSPILVSLSEDGSAPSYIYPTINDPETILISPGQNVEIFCPGKTNRKSTEVVEPGVLQISGSKLRPSRSIENIECAGNSKIRVRKHTDVNKNNGIRLDNVTCEETSEGAILRKMDKKCGSGERLEIGYDLGNDGFLKTIDLCHDETEAKTLWAHAVLVPVNQEAYRHKGSGGKSFRTGQLYGGMHMASKGPYDLVQQFSTILRLVGDNDKIASRYSSVSTKDRRFLAKGHLIARADKFYKSEQDSTYFYANVVPMWQQINAKPGNWFFVEEYIRNLAFQKESELDVWAGGIGTLDLVDKSSGGKISKRESDVHDNLLVLDDKIPVPKVLFKCTVDKSNEEALCFLVVNNPYLSKAQVEKSGNEYIVCEERDVCKTINPNHNDAKLGYFYCCSLGDFYEKFNEELGLEDLEDFKHFKELELFNVE